MDFSIKTIDAKSASTAHKAIKTGCIVVGVFENKKLSTVAASLDKAGDIAAALKNGRFTHLIGKESFARGPIDGIFDRHGRKSIQDVGSVFGWVDPQASQVLHEVRRRAGFQSFDPFLDGE